MQLDNEIMQIPRNGQLHQEVLKFSEGVLQFGGITLLAMRYR